MQKNQQVECLMKMDCKGLLLTQVVASAEWFNGGEGLSDKLRNEGVHDDK